MRDLLVIAEHAADRAGMRPRRLRERFLENPVARAEQGELSALLEQRRQRVEQQVEALLAGHAA